MFEKINRIALKLYSGCNLNCDYCFQQFDEKYKPTTFTDYENIYKFLKTLPFDNVVTVTFCGGEMTLKPQLIIDCEKKVFRRLEREQDVRFKYAIITNGTKIDTLLDLIDNGYIHPEVCNLSWDGLYSASLSRKSSGIFDDKFFQTVVKTVGQSSYNKDISIVHALTPSTIPYLFESFKYCLDNGAKNFGYYPIHEANYTEEFCQEFEKQFDKTLGYIIDNYSEDDINFFNLEVLKIRSQKPFYYTCVKLGHNYYINPIGEIYPCIYMGDNKVYKLGSIYDGLNQEAVDKFVSDYLHYPDCDYKNCKCSFCGECPAACYVYNGNLNHKFKNLCQIRIIEKKIFDKYLPKMSSKFLLLKHYSTQEDLVKNKVELTFSECETGRIVNELLPPHAEELRNWGN